jgi:ABC-2 type transport system permease protein
LKRALRDALFLARFDLKYLLRQRETLMWTFLMPGLFFYFIGTVTGGAGFAPDPTRPSPIDVELPYTLPTLAPVNATESAGSPESVPQVDLSAEPLLAALQARLEAQNFSVRFTDRETSTETAQGAAAKRLVWPPLPPEHATWSAALAAGVAVQPRLVANRAGNAASLDQLRVNQALAALLLDLTVLDLRETPLEAHAFEALAQEPRALHLNQHSAGQRPAPPLGFEQTIPGTMIMFTLLILLTGGSILLIQERRAGLFRRLASSPISIGALLVGKWIARMGLAVIQLAFSMVLGVVLFDMDWGPALGAVCVLLLLWGAFCASLSLYLSTVARTEGQMTGMAIIGSMMLAALGGCWWPIEITPGWMQDLAGCLPTGWAMGAMHNLVHFGQGVESVLGYFAALAGATILLLFLGTRRFRYE